MKCLRVLLLAAEYKPKTEGELIDLAMQHAAHIPEVTRERLTELLNKSIREVLVQK